MRRVSLHVDYDWISAHLASEGYPATPSVLAQELVNASHGLGLPGARSAYGDWSKHPEWVASSLCAEGFRTAGPLTSPEGWSDLLKTVEREAATPGQLSLILVTGNGNLLDKTEQLKGFADELVLWQGEMEANLGALGWDRVDWVSRLLRIAEPGVCVVLDFEGLVQLVWNQDWVTDIESVLERLELAIARVGPPAVKLAYADWHKLPVMRDRQGDPITHETERLLRNAGFRTPEIASGDADEDGLARRISNLFDTAGLLDAAVFVGRTEGLLESIELSQLRVHETHVWSDAPPEGSARVLWQPLRDVLRSSAEDRQETSGGGDASRCLLPGLWSRMALFVDRLLSDSDNEAVESSRLFAALVHGASFITRRDQASALLSLAVSRGLLMRDPRNARTREASYRLHEDHPELVLIRDLLKGLIAELGPDPGEGEGLPVAVLLDRLAANVELNQGRSLNRRALASWINFLVDEGILIRFNGVYPELGTAPAPSIAFSPTPRPSVQFPDETEQRAERPAKPRQRRGTTGDKTPPVVREHLVVVMDNYAVRHRRTTVPMSVIRKQLIVHGGRVLEDAIRESIRQGDIQKTRKGTGSMGERNGGLVLNQESKFVRHVLAVKDRIINMLRRMAPIGQPIGESRMLSGMVQKARLGDNEEAALWISMLQRERVIMRERQLVTALGPSYTLSLDDPVVRQAGRRQSSPEYRGRTARHRTRSGGSKNSGRRLSKRRK